MVFFIFILTICNTMTNNILLYWLCVSCVYLMGEGSCSCLDPFLERQSPFSQDLRSLRYSHIARMLITFTQGNQMLQYFLSIINIFYMESFLFIVSNFGFIQLINYYLFLYTLTLTCISFGSICLTLFWGLTILSGLCHDLFIFSLMNLQHHSNKFIYQYFFVYNIK